MGIMTNVYEFGSLSNSLSIPGSLRVNNLLSDWNIFLYLSSRCSSFEIYFNINAGIDLMKGFYGCLLFYRKRYRQI